MLPTSSNKLLAQWQGPYQVVEHMGKVTYLVDMHDRRKRRRVFHINMLKAFHVRRSVEKSYFTEENIDEEADTEVPVWNDDPRGDISLGDQLDIQQKRELEGLLSEYRKVFSNKPQRTDMLQHHIDTRESRPVRLPPYRLPHAYRDSVEKELKEMERVVSSSHPLANGLPR